MNLRQFSNKKPTPTMSNRNPLARDNIKNIYALSPMQEGMFFHHLYDKHSSTYFEQFSYRLHGDLNIPCVERALNELMKRHDILRTVFVQKSDKLLQVVLKERLFDFYYQDLCGYVGDSEKENYIEKFIAEDRQKGFDLSKDNLMRVGILKLNEGEYEFIWSHHHILMDGWCSGILVYEFFEIYNSFLESRKDRLPEVKQYREYIRWLEKQDREQSQNYWKKYLESYEEIASIPKAKEFLPGEEKYENCKVSFSIEKEKTHKLYTIAQTNNTTLNTIIQAVWGILLGKYNGRKDVVFGSVVSGRPAEVEGVESIIGLFINTIPVRIQYDDQTTFEHLLHRIHENITESEPYQYYPLVRIQSESALKNNLLDHILIFNNYPLTESIEGISQKNAQRRFEISNVKVFEQTNYNFNIMISPREQISVSFLYNGYLYADDIAERIAGHLNRVIDQIIENERVYPKEITILTEKEKRQILFEFNMEIVDDLAGKTIHQLFQESVEKEAHHTAVVCEDKKVTDKELNIKANRLAGKLRDEGVTRGTLVGILMDRSIEMMVGVLGILKAGGAYIPIEPDYPRERISYILKDSGLAIVLTGPPYIDLCDDLQWDIESLKTYICLGQSTIEKDRDRYRDAMEESRLLWNHMAAQHTNDYAASGWISSYTREVFDDREMQEFYDNVLVKVQPYIHPEARVLEIGCGSGIVMFQLAPLVKLYYGTDISDEILQRCKTWINNENIKNTKLFCLSADDISRLENIKFDLIIVNSVIQYFPSYRYLRNFLHQVIRLLSDRGILFIGDIRDKALQMDYYQSLFSHTKDPETDILNKKRSESELFLEREFFIDYLMTYPFETDIRFSNKIGEIKNELSLYRFDALVSVNKQHPKRDVLTPLCKCQMFYPSEDAEFREGVEIPTKVYDSDLAYVTYTSGSTGKPKGVMIEHRNVVNFNLNLSGTFGFKPSDVIYGLTTFTFDISVLELICSLLSGIRLVIESSIAPADISGIKDRIHNEDISILQVTPSRLISLIEFFGISILSNIRVLLVGGEEFPGKLLDTLRQVKNIDIFNVYGPTETTIWSSARYLNNGKPDIGKPLQNESIYIISNENQLVPVGFPGEICIAGSGVGRGYLNRVGLTTEIFIPHFFEKDERLYRTGDLGKWLADGNLEFSGRIDHQVKVRGHRIELGEIENQLHRFPGIREAAVAVKVKNDDKYLCAYMVADSADRELSISEIREHLAKDLPDYMIPASFVRLEKMPLTPNGKIHRKALPDPDGIGLGSSGEYVAPKNDVERALAEIWEQVLGRKPIGINENFFMIGGDSIKSIQIAARMNKAGYRVEIKDIFDHPVISKLAPLVKEEVETSSSVSNAAKGEITPPWKKKEGDFTYKGLSREKRDQLCQNYPVEDIYTLSPMQEGILFYVLYNKNTTAYFYQLSYRIHGKLDVPVVRKCVDHLVHRYQVLRTVFIYDGSERPMQVVLKERDVDVSYQDLRKITAEEDKGKIINDFKESDRRCSFDLSQDVLMRLSILHTDDDEYEFIWSFHHILMDGWCIGILISDFLKTYNCFLGNRAPELPTPSPYRIYIEWLEKQNKERSKSYWKKYLEGYTRPTGFPQKKRFARNEKPYHGGRVSTVITREKTDQLKRLAGINQVTLNTILQTAWGILLGKYSNRMDVVFGSTVSGRPPEVEGVEVMVGLFINTIPVRIKYDGKTTVVDLLNTVQKQALECQPHHYIALADIQSESALKQDLLDHILVFENYPISEQIAGLMGESNRNSSLPTMEIVNSESFAHSNYDLMVTFYLDEALNILFAYNRNIYDRETLEKVLVHYTDILDQMIENPGTGIQDLFIEHQLLKLESNINLEEQEDFGF